MESNIKRIDDVDERKRVLRRRMSWAMFWAGAGAIMTLLCSVDAVTYFAKAELSEGWRMAGLAVLNVVSVLVNRSNHRDCGEELELLDMLD